MTPAVHRRQLGLIADCTQCFGLCCVGLSITASADFTIDKPSGTACPNQLFDYRCGVHPQLRERGFARCTTYDCFGAGRAQLHAAGHGRNQPGSLRVSEPPVDPPVAVGAGVPGVTCRAGSTSDRTRGLQRT